jgi:hypothetical protein
MRKVEQAEPYNSVSMGSNGTAKNMLIRQFEFPHTYRDNEAHVSMYDDRCYQNDYEHADKCFKKHKVRNLHVWALQASESEILQFLKEILQVEKTHPNKIWTGFRILGSVDRNSGYPVYMLELFAKTSPRTKTYTGRWAPNVKDVQFKMN